MQKLLTIYLDNDRYRDGKIFGGVSDRHGMVEEHLGDYLTHGWTVRSMAAFGGAAEQAWVRGWIAVVIERPDDARG